MWILECDGDLFHHRKTWLRPGQKYLFGRTKPVKTAGEQFCVISNKSVSRKHLVIAVSSVESGSGGDLNSRSIVTVTDESKLGTELDNERFAQESRLLTKDEHYIKLGGFEQTFKIIWLPVVFTYTLPNNPKRDHEELLTEARNRVERFDIKTILPFTTDGTTHVISNKRNLPKALRALINGRYIVTDEYVRAVIEVATSPGYADDGETPKPSLLEQDFLENWPNPLQYLPPPAKEPVVRSAKLFEPDSQRNELLKDFTFIFADKSQYENLGPMLEDAGARSLLYNLKLGETELSDFVTYVREIASQNGIETFDDSEMEKAVVVVRFRGKDDSEQWALNFLRDLDGQIGQRSVEQNEFLDAILMKNAKSLRRPLSAQDSSLELPSTAPVTRPANILDIAAGSTEFAHAEAQSTKQRSRRTVVKSKFKGFDDFDDTISIPVHSDVEHEILPACGQNHDDEAMDVDAESQGLFVSQAAAPERTSTPINARKRAASLKLDEAEMLDELLPATRAMKKRRLEEERAGISIAYGKQPTGETNPPVKSKAKKEPLDVRTVARTHASELDAKGRVDSGRQSEERVPDANEIASLRDLAIVEEWTPPIREPGPASRTRSATARTGINTDQSSRWDDRWNGRKNFKKFRRKGQTDHDDIAGAARRAARVIVPLEEFRDQAAVSLSESYWLLDGSTPTSATQNTTISSHSNSKSQATATNRPRRNTAKRGPRQGQDVTSNHIDVVDSANEDEDEAIAEVPEEAGENIVVVAASGNGSEPQIASRVTRSNSRETRSNSKSLTQQSASNTIVHDTPLLEGSGSSGVYTVRGSNPQLSASISTSISTSSGRQKRPRVMSQLQQQQLTLGDEDDEDEDEQLRFKFRKRT